MADKGPWLSWLKPALIWLAIAAVYFGVVRIDIKRQDFDGDELITSYAVRRGSVLDVVQHRFRAGHPPLYFVTARLWVGQFGRSGYALHCLSAAIGALTLLAIAGLARELGLGRWSYAAAFLWALHPILQFDARYARPMIGVILGTILALWILSVALRTGDRRAWIGLLVLGLLGSFWSALFVLVWLSLGVGVALVREWRGNKKFWCVMGAIAASHAAVIGYTATVATRDPFMWIPLPQGFGWIGSFLDGVGGYRAGVLPYFVYDTSMFFPICIIAAVAAGVGGLVRRGVAADPWLLVAASAVAPALALAALTLAGKPFLLPRYMVPVVPGAFLFLVRALAGIKPARAGELCAAGLALLLMAGIPGNIERHKTGIREAVLDLESRLDRRRDLVVPVNQQTREALRLFSRHKINNIILPPGELNSSAKQIEEALGRPRRLWVFSTNSRNLTHTPEWDKYAGLPFYSAVFGKARVRGFELKPAGADRVTTSAQAARPS